MKKKYPHGIGPTGRWLIYSGIPFSICATLLTLTLRDGHILGVSEKSLPYVVAGVPALLMTGGMVLYGHFPKHLVIPIGIVGWMISISVLCWFFWFGPGSFGYK